MADRAEMHADLVRASGVNGHLAKRQAWHLERAGDSGNGFPRASRPRGHLLPMDRIAADGGIDTPAGRHGAPHERDVFLLDLAILELPRQFLVRGIVLRDDHHAGRAAIEPVDDSRPQHAADAAEVGDVMQQRIDERAGGVTRAGMHDHARRLVDDDDVGILVKDLERHRLGFGGGRCGGGKIDGDAISRTHREVRARLARGDAHVTVFDQLLDLRP